MALFANFESVLKILIELRIIFMIKIFIFFLASTLALLIIFHTESGETPCCEGSPFLVKNKYSNSTSIYHLSTDSKVENDNKNTLLFNSTEDGKEFNLESCDDLDEMIFQKSSSSSVFYILTSFEKLNNKKACTSILNKYISQALISPSQSAFFIDWIAGDGETASVDLFLDESLLAMSAYRDNGEIEEKIVARLRNFYTPEAMKAIEIWVENNSNKESSTQLIDIIKKYEILQFSQINSQS